MNNLEKLSDEQLINLFQNSKLDKDLKATIISEIDRRDLSQQEEQPSKKLSTATIIGIILTGFLLKFHINQANAFLGERNKAVYKAYMKYVMIGIGFNFILLILIAKYIIKPYF